MSRKIGPIILDLLGPELSIEESEILNHSLVGGVILFTRNYENPQQLAHLCKKIRQARRDPLLITVDQEGGRVQRFREGFTRLPPMGELGKLYENSPAEAIQRAKEYGKTLAAELFAVGIDLSFAPVLDVNKELNAVIGDRGFHQDPIVVARLAKSLIDGMHEEGMTATGKHFPGHGSVTLDSHHEMPVDERSYEIIAAEDMSVFAELIRSGIDAIMSAHIVFPAIDTLPVGFSERWLKKILREDLQFSGVIFSDDLNMKGAAFVGDYAERARMALQAGCDMALICNNRQGAIQILDQLPQRFFIERGKFEMLQGKHNLVKI